MTINATIDSKLVRAIADEQLANNVFMIEWLVKAQQQWRRSNVGNSFAK